MFKWGGGNNFNSIAERKGLILGEIAAHTYSKQKSLKPVPLGLLLLSLCDCLLLSPRGGVGGKEAFQSFLDPPPALHDFPAKEENRRK